MSNDARIGPDGQGSRQVRDHDTQLRGLDSIPFLVFQVRESASISRQFGQKKLQQQGVKLWQTTAARERVYINKVMHIGTAVVFYIFIVFSRVPDGARTGNQKINSKNVEIDSGSDMRDSGSNQVGINFWTMNLFTRCA